MKEKKELMPFEIGLETTKKRLEKANKAMKNVEKYLLEKDIEKVFNSAFNFANEAEKLTLLARILPAYTGHPNAAKLIENQMLENAQIKIGFTKEGWFCAMIPTLLPKKSKGSSDFIRDMLYPAMARFFKGKSPVRYTDCVLVFRHVYERSRLERQYRDHDNIETNIVADILALYVLHDDNPLNCSHYYFSAAGDKNETQIFVIPKDEFIDFIYAEKTYERKEVLLYERCP